MQPVFYQFCPIVNRLLSDREVAAVRGSASIGWSPWRLGMTSSTVSSMTVSRCVMSCNDYQQSKVTTLSSLKKLNVYK
jgi:hypothetical protein